MNNKILIKYWLLILAINASSVANAEKFKPSPIPAFSTSQAKPNIHMVYDDSASMQTNDTIMPEHSYGFGSPICQRQTTQWHNERKNLGEYDPFSGNTYIPWDDEKAVNGLINGKKKPPRIINCTKVSRSVALDYAYKTIMHKYRDKAYIGVSFLWQVNDNVTSLLNVGNGLIKLPIKDYSGLTDIEFQRQIITPVSNMILKSPGNTPMYPAVYEAIKMYRGQPVTKMGVNQRFTQFPRVLSECNGKHCYFPYVQHETPLRYRCQQNHMIVMTDGEPNDTTVWGIGETDGIVTGNLSSHLKVNGVNQSISANVTGKKIGELTAKVDLRYAVKPVFKNGNWESKNKDDAGKAWNDNFSTAMPIITHSVSLFVNPKSPIYLDITSPTKGMNLGFAQGNGNAEDLMYAFDTIFSSIIKSTSSTLAVSDRINVNALKGRPTITAGEVDLSTVGTVVYNTTYSFRQRFGNIRAMAPYISGYTEEPGTKIKKPIISDMELWNTNNTIKANQGRYLTYLDMGKGNNGVKFAHLTDANVKKQFASIYNSLDYGVTFHDNYIEWLTNFEKTTHANQLRGRLQPMGSVTNADLVIVNKDVLNINVANDKMSKGLSSEMINFLKYKAKYQPVNYLIISDNDGFINFINAQRGLTNKEKAGARNTAYFPQLLVHRLDEIAKDNREATLVLEGKTNLVDGKVYQQTVGDMYATIGLTSMGSGGKGLVGYRVYGAPKNVVEDWVLRSTIPPAIKTTDPIDKVLPLFEITNEGPKEYRTKGFENLGYTYSGFSFFNRVITNERKEARGQVVGVFGNGFGVDQSSLYFIDAYTGEKLHEIVLSKEGGGAGTPSIIVSPDSTNGQKINKIYVGDYSGALYRVEFVNADFTDDNTTRVTLLFKAATAPSNFGQSAISVKPLVTKNHITGLYSISFGTGIAASQDLDRRDNSLVEHSVYNILDRNKQSNVSTVTVAEFVEMKVPLVPLLTTKNLKVGTVNYKDGTKIDYLLKDTHQLDIAIPAIENPNSGNVTGGEDGWYVRLIADGVKSGERIIQNPKYDAARDAVIFATWGIYERENAFEVDGLYDPCLADAAFGKILSFKLKNGGATSTKGSVANEGTTNTAEGGVTGTDIIEDPEGNSTSHLEEIDKNLQRELLRIVGEESSTYTEPKDAIEVECKGDIHTGTGCTVREVETIQLYKKRISINEMFST